MDKSPHNNIPENNPNNIDRALSYMNRDQYGDWEILNWASTIARPENTNWKRYTLDKNNPSLQEQLSFFINYQINEMYLRYFHLHKVDCEQQSLWFAFFLYFLLQIVSY